MGETAGNGTRSWISHLCAIVVGCVFLFAAQSKIIEPRQFVVAIKNYHMIPETYLHLMALMLPWVEVGGALLLIVPPTRRAGALLVGGMLLMFMGAVTYAAFIKGYNIDCGCFGKNSGAAGAKTLAFDVVLLGLTVLSAKLTRPKGSEAFSTVVNPGPVGAEGIGG